MPSARKPTRRIARTTGRISSKLLVRRTRLRPLHSKSALASRGAVIPDMWPPSNRLVKPADEETTAPLIHQAARSGLGALQCFAAEYGSGSPTSLYPPPSSGPAAWGRALPFHPLPDARLASARSRARLA